MNCVTFTNGLIPAGKKVLLFYSDTINVIYCKIDIGPVNNAIPYPVQWANNNSVINGKLHALIYSVEALNNIISYDNYAEVELPVTNGEHDSSFTAGNVNFYVVKLDASGNACGNMTTPSGI